MKADPKFSAGARLERAAFRRTIRSRLTRIPLGDQNALRALLAWVLARQQRYDRKPGGLGK